jgi:transketolase
MSEIKKVATRDSYGNALVELGKEHDDLIVLDADLAGATKTGMFKKAFPERHWDIGIAEANMTGIAAGVAACGKVPFISSFAMFAAGRAYEQVRNAIGYPHLNVKIGATHAGISVGEDGATHQCLEDIGLMREIPGMVVINPADDVEARAAVKAAYEHVGPVYLRFGRLAVPVFNDEATYKFEIGKGIVLKEGTDVTIFATGLCVNETIEAEKMLAADGINAVTMLLRISFAVFSSSKFVIITLPFFLDQSSVRPSSARSNVTSSIYSKSPPTGTPLAILVTLIPVGFINLLIYIAVVSPSRLEFVAMITSSTSCCNRCMSSFNLMSFGPIPSIGEIAP